jgi:DNA-binding LacI/PurR family transcriptional regulator
MPSFALSDEMAAGAIQAARQMGVGVPQDLAIVGFDDHDFAAAMGITTVRQPVAELGELAAQALLDAVEGQPWSEDRILPTVSLCETPAVDHSVAQIRC